MAKRLLSILLAAAMLLPVLFVISASAASVMRGDVDDDGKISSADARLALRGSVGLEELTIGFITRADVNADGTVESADARTILRASVGLDKIKENTCNHQVEKWESVTQRGGGFAPYHKGVCKICGETVLAEHTFTTEVTKPAACTVPGETVEKCVCGATGETGTLPAEHKWEEIAGTKREATCTEDGSVEMKCALCGKTKTEKLPKGHVFGVESSCTEPQVCTRCGKEIAPALGHSVKEDASVTPTTGIRCTRCGKVVIPSFNELVNALKKENHTYSGFTQTISSATQPVFTGMMEVMINMLPKKERDQMMAEFTANETDYTPFVRNVPITEDNFNLMGDTAVSKLADEDVQSITTERVKGVDFLAELPDAYMNGRKQAEDLTAIKNVEIGDVIKVTVVLPTEKNPKKSAIPKIDSELGAIIDESGSEIGNLAGDMDIFGENAMKMDVQNQADITVTYYFDAETNAPIAAHYDDAVMIDSKMDLYLNDDGSVSKKSTGSISLSVGTEMDSYYFFDDYFNG